MRKLLPFFCLFFLNAAAQSGPSNTYSPRYVSDTLSVSKTALGVDLIAGNQKGITVYPNPANDHIMVSLSGNRGEKREIRLVNSMGQPILQINNMHENTYFLDVTKLRKGVYVVEVLSRGNISRTRWIKE
ncbi:MAG TPA: T9SS type A sorting domain-containing protein [Flavobacterium sp.]|jgi:hypothetical protein